MGTSRLRKRITRALKVSWREQPTRYDIEALQANTRRVGLVIKVRWALVLVLAVYSVVGAWIYSQTLPVGELTRLMVVPAAALLFVMLYNTFYLLTYRRLGNIAFLNHLQLFFDALVVSVLVYYSGGASSWFWTMYPLFIFEAAFILPRARSAWMLAGAIAVLQGIVLWGMYLGFLPPVRVPFANSALHENVTYVSVRYLWQVTVLAGSAAIATLMVSSLGARERELKGATIVDEATGLYNRPYFHRAFAAELSRARRDDRQMYVVLADLDHLGEFNRKWGLDRGDRLLAEVAMRLRNVMSPGTDPLLSANVVARYGGEEFAMLLTEMPDSVVSHDDPAFEIGDAVRRVVSGALVDGVGVTASVGVAVFPRDGATPDELLLAADDALGASSGEGGNKASVAGREPV